MKTHHVNYEFSLAGNKISNFKNRIPKLMNLLAIHWITKTSLTTSMILFRQAVLQPVICFTVQFKKNVL